MSEQTFYITVEAGPSCYDVILGDGILSETGPMARKFLSGSKCALITDTHVAPLYAETVESSLRGAGWNPIRIVIPAGERSKSLSQAEACCESMIEAGLDRKSSVFALGGGVVGDLGGFVASIYFRGIPFVQIPTTVVAQVDSSVGGKTGVNARLGKNLIGSFHQPSLVVADPQTLHSLPSREFKEGLAEIVKHALIRDAGMLSEIHDHPTPEIAALLARNVRIKAAIVAEDEKETSGVRALLNFGHTIGHAIENAAGYGQLLHGEAISLGLVAELFLSVKHTGLDEEAAKRAVQLLDFLGLPTRLPSALDEQAILQAMKTDKKFEEGKMKFALISRPGQALLCDRVTQDDVKEALQTLR